MPAKKRFKTQYPGVHYIEGKAAGSGRKEPIYYIVYRKNGKLIEERVGRRFQDGMTPRKARRIRIECIEGKRLSRKETRDKENAGVESKKEFRDKESICFSKRYKQQEEIEETLSKTEKKLRSLIETTSDWVWEVDLNGVYTYASPKVKNLLGYDVDEIIGTKMFDLMPSEGRKQSLVRFFNEKCRLGQAFAAQKIVMLHKDGHTAPIEVNGAPIFDGDGRLSGWCGFDKDITQREFAKKALQERETDLKNKAYDLQEANTALKVMLKHVEEDRKELEEKVLANVKQLVEPYIEELTKSGLNSIQETYIGILQSNLNEVTSPFTRKLSSKYVKLTPAEIRVANLVKRGKITKEIAELLKISPKTISVHRENIRKKLGINKKRENLRSHLLSLD